MTKKINKVVGFLVLPEDHVVREHFETARWYTDHKIVAGRYPVYDTGRIGLYNKKPVLQCDFPTIIVAEDKTPLFCGNPIPGCVERSDVGKASSYTAGWGDYEFGGETPWQHYKWCTYEPLVMYTGLSMSVCIADICRGMLLKEQVELLVCGTKIENEACLEKVIEHYKKNYWEKFPEKAAALARAFWAAGLIKQPRAEGLPCHNIARGHWLDSKGAYVHLNRRKE